MGTDAVGAGMTACCMAYAGQARQSFALYGRRRDMRRKGLRPRQTACFIYGGACDGIASHCHWINPFSRIRVGRLEHVCGHWRCRG